MDSGFCFCSFCALVRPSLSTFVLVGSRTDSTVCGAISDCDCDDSSEYRESSTVDSSALLGGKPDPYPAETFAFGSKASCEGVCSIGGRDRRTDGDLGAEGFWCSSRRALSMASCVWSISFGTSAAVRPVVGIGGRTEISV